MGMYTEIVAGFQLRADVPNEVVSILKYICGMEHDIDFVLPSHEFFSKERWRMVGQCSSYYFGFSDSHSIVKRDGNNEYWMVSIRANLKNYDGEIESFFDWIRPYIDEYGGSGEQEMIGYSIYENSSEPTIYYLDAEP